MNIPLFFVLFLLNYIVKIIDMFRDFNCSACVSSGFEYGQEVFNSQTVGMKCSHV